MEKEKYLTQNYETDGETIRQLCEMTEATGTQLMISVLLFYVFRVVKHAIREHAEWSSGLSKWACDVSTVSLLHLLPY